MLIYAKKKTNRFIRISQTKFRAENYIYLQDVLRNDEGIKNLSHLVIQPSSFIDGLQYIYKQTQDAFCYVSIQKKYFGSCISGTRLKIVMKQMFHLRLKKIIGFLNE